MILMPGIAAAEDLPANAPIIKSVLQLVSNQIIQCWAPKAGNNTVIKVDIDISQDGIIKFAGFENEKSDADYQAAATAAKSAVLDPACNPLVQLPPANTYYIWKNMVLVFDPKTIR